MEFILKKIIGITIVFIGVLLFRYVYKKTNKNRLDERGYMLSVILIIIGVLIILGIRGFV